MSSYIRLEAEGRAVLDHLRCYKAELYNVAGPMLAHRRVTVAQTSAWGRVFIDRGYPFPEAGFVYAWQFYNWETGTIIIGDMVGLIIRLVSGNLEVVHVMEMKQNMDGKGIWEPAEVDGGSGFPAVQAGDMLGIWIAESPSPGGFLPRILYDTLPDGSLGTGVYEVTNVDTKPTDTTSWAETSALQNARRIGSFIARGDSASGDETLTMTQITDAVDEPYVVGDGPELTAAYQSNIAASTSAPEYYVYNESGGALTGHANLFEVDTTSRMSIPAGSKNHIAVRLDDGNDARLRVGRILLGPRVQPGGIGYEGLTLTLSYSQNNTDVNPDNLTDWVDFYTYPADSHYAGTTEPDEANEFIHLSRMIKWLRLTCENTSGSTRHAYFLGIYPVATAAAPVGDNGKYELNFGDGLSDLFMATYEGSSMMITQDVAGSAVLNCDHAENEDFNGMANGVSCWIRTASSRVRKEISATAPPVFPALGGTVTLSAIETITAGAYVDSRMVAIRVDGYDSANRKIRESAPIIFANTWREKWFAVREEIEGVL
jgi:hypothetical protein